MIITSQELYPHLLALSPVPRRPYTYLSVYLLLASVGITGINIKFSVVSTKVPARGRAIRACECISQVFSPQSPPIQNRRRRLSVLIKRHYYDWQSMLIKISGIQYQQLSTPARNPRGTHTSLLGLVSVRISDYFWEQGNCMRN